MSATARRTTRLLASRLVTRRNAWTLAIAVAAFGAGTQSSHLLEPAHAAAAENMQPIIVNLIDMKLEEIAAKPSPTGLRSRNLGAADGMTIGVQEGPTSKHYHAQSHEMQYVLSGSGTAWLGEKQVQIRPGDLLIIPKGVHHGGLGDGIRLMALKTPPQMQGDTVQVK